MRNLFLVILLFCVSPVLAQTETINVLNSTIVWKATEVSFLEDSTEVIIECEFSTKSSRKIDMKIGSRIREFNIESIEGEWLNINDLGRLTYYGNAEKTKVVVIERTVEGIFFTLDLTATGGQKHTFTIESYEFH